MDPVAVRLDLLTTHLLERAAANPASREAQRVELDHEHLRMTAVGFAAGAVLPEHRNPGEAVLQVLAGRVRLIWGRHDERSLDVETGMIARVPDAVHRVEALEPSVMLLTAIRLPGDGA